MSSPSKDGYMDWDDYRQSKMKSPSSHHSRFTGVLGTTPGGHCDFIDPQKDLPLLSPTRQRAMGMQKLEHALSPESSKSGWGSTRRRVLKAALLEVHPEPRSLDEVMADLAALDEGDKTEELPAQVDAVEAAVAQLQEKLNDQELAVLRLQATVNNKKEALRVYEGREKELRDSVHKEEKAIDAVDDNVEEHARVLRRHEDILDKREASLDHNEIKQRENLAEQQEKWDKQMMYMERAYEKKKQTLAELKEKVKAAGLHEEGMEMEEKMHADVEKKVVKDLEAKALAEKDLQAMEHKQDELFASMEGNPMADLLRKETQVHRMSAKLRHLHHELPEVAHHQHVFIREVADYRGEDPGEISGTDDEGEDPVDEEMLPAGWSLEHLVFVKLVKKDTALQGQLRSLASQWWAPIGSKKPWEDIATYIKAEWGWDDSQLHFLDAACAATKKRRDDGSFKAMMNGIDFLEVFRKAVIDSGRDVHKWRAFDVLK